MESKFYKKFLTIIPVFVIFMLVGFAFFNFANIKKLTASALDSRKCQSSDSVICISRVLKLDGNKEIIEDITTKVENKDNNWASVKNNQYVRVVFEKPLNNTNDITIFARTNNWQEGQSGSRIEVYTENDGKISEFLEIKQARSQQIILTNLKTPTDTFDLKIIGDIDIDYIVDPTGPGINLGTGVKILTGLQIATPVVACASSYTPDGAGWAKIADTTVRDIDSTYNATVAKDIYCDGDDSAGGNCILWTDGATAPGTVCIATDANVYGNILWDRKDIATTQTWADSNFSISGGDIGGTHATTGVGANNMAIGTKKWLARDYTSAPGTFNAMDACKAKGAGWRTPNILELDSIRDQAMGSSPYSRLPNMTFNFYWSSSESSTTNPFSLLFFYGNGDNGFAKSNTFNVRCVRGAM